MLIEYNNTRGSKGVKVMPPRYTDEFKEAAVKQVLENDYSVKETAERLGVHPYSLSKWVKQFNDPMTHKMQDEKHQEILRLKKELKRVTEERDIFLCLHSL